MAIFFPEAARPLIVGHRGVRREGLAENTPAAFAEAGNAGAAWIEIDVRRTADDEAVLYHNGRTPDEFPVVKRTAAELAQLYGICTLREGLAALPVGMGVNVEVKNLPAEPDYDPTDAIVTILAAEIADHLGTRPLLFSSFNPLVLEALRTQLPGQPTGLITWQGIALNDAIPVAQEYGADALIPRVDAPGVDADGIAAAHAAGLEVMVWTVNDIAAARRLADGSVDAMCTDDPAALLAGLRSTRPA